MNTGGLSNEELYGDGPWPSDDQIKELLKGKEGAKHDGGKLQWHLLPVEAVEEIVKVLMYGAEKYSPYNWKKVPDFENRYFDATMRHMSEWLKGKKYEDESMLRVLAHAGCNILFLIWKEMEKEREHGL